MKQITFCGNKNIIGDKIKEIRCQRNLSQDDLAAKMQTMNCNIDQQMVSKIENNCRQVTDYELACFSVCLQTTSEELLSDFYNKIQRNI